ncbi:MAG TPA: glycosyltransferase [Tepidiformaceae bacterium]|nr:glycosyltransferase [Tepidiformaceae bacterium]
MTGATPDKPTNGGTELVYSRRAQFITLAYLLFGTSYLWWRTFHTVNTDAPWLSIPLLLADYLGFLFFGLFAFNLWARVRRQAPPAPPGHTVDVFIPTYNEPLSVLKPTVLAALAMRYPHRTYVLDDGRRDEVKRFCAEVGVDYLTRPDNRGAKAGNINAALPQTSGEFIAIFDADHAPFEDFLVELLGYFDDHEVALVQSPQAYYNLDSFQHSQQSRFRGKPWHEQSIFYDTIMPGKDRMNAAFWCGSSAILRRTALEQVGGVNTLTVTEDMHTAMLMHAAGWKSVYHDRELAVGIAPDDLEPFLVQRLRWAQGAMELLRKDNPLFKRGLGWRQRVAYFTSVAYVIEYIPKAIYLATPPIVLVTGVLPMTDMGWNFLFRFLPYYLLGMLATRLLTGGTNPYLRAERFHVLKIEIMLRAISLLVVPRKLKFKVTPKSASEDESRWAVLRHLRTQIFVGGFCLVAAIWGLASWLLGASWALTGVSLLVTIGWAGFNAGLIGLLARSVLRRQHRRQVYRFPVQVPIVVKHGRRQQETETVDLSTAGLGWHSPTWYERGTGVTIEIQPANGQAIPVRATITLCRAEGTAGFRVGAEFTGIPADVERQLILMLYQGLAPGTVHRLGGPDELELAAA